MFYLIVSTIFHKSFLGKTPYFQTIAGPHVVDYFDMYLENSNLLVSERYFEVRVNIYAKDDVNSPID